MEKKEKEKVIEAIKYFELFTNGLQNINGAYVKVKNLKDERTYYVADVEIGVHEEYWEERFLKCEYPKKFIKDLIKNLEKEKV